MIHSAKQTFQKQGGFTLVELLVALAITAIIGTGIAMSINQLIVINSSSVNRMQAVKQVENALLYINYDAQMAQTITTASGSGFPFTITYREWNNTNHRITYSIVTPSGGAPKYLQRSETIASGSPNIRTLANYVDNTAALTNCSYSNSSKQLTVTLTANVGGFQPASETRTLNVRLRPVQQ
jgi:prepilin-type N-terminal cleavage/methylation domain-containing protein